MRVILNQIFNSVCLYYEENLRKYPFSVPKFTLEEFPKVLDRSVNLVLVI